MNNTSLAARSSGRTLRLIIPAFAAAAMAMQAYGAANTWQGASALWSNNANWSLGGTATTDTITIPVFPVGTAGTSSTNDTGLVSFAGITFLGNAGNFKITTTATTNYNTLTGNSPSASLRAGALTFVANSGTTVTMNNGANGNVGDGNILVLESAGGSFVLTGAQAGFMRSRDIFKTSSTTDFAYNGGGSIRAPIYNSGAVDGGGGDNNFYTATAGANGLVLGGTSAVQKHNLITGTITGQSGGTVTTMKITGSGAVDIGLAAAQTLELGTGSGSTSGGLIRTGGGTTTFTGGTGVRYGSGLIWYLYTDTAADTVIFNTPMLALSTNHLSKNGLGTVVVGSTSALTGQTYVNEGTLLVNGTHTGGSTYWVNAGATLGGTGSITTAAAINTQVSGTLAPGNSLGVTPDLQTGKLTINTTSFNLLNGSTFAAQLGGTTAGSFDQLALTNAAGAISLAGTVALNLTWVGAGSPVGTYLIIDTSAFSSAPGWAVLFNGTTNGGPVTIGSLPGGYTSTIGYAANGATITIIAAVPEPQEYALGIVALLALVILHRRRATVA